MSLVHLEETADCPICGTENAFVLKDDDKVCEQCDYMPPEQSRSVVGYGHDDPWGNWWQRRRENENYEGWTGENRIRMVGGFVGAYVFEEDF